MPIYLGAEGKMKVVKASLFSRVPSSCFQSLCWSFCGGIQARREARLLLIPACPLFLLSPCSLGTVLAGSGYVFLYLGLVGFRATTPWASVGLRAVTSRGQIWLWFKSTPLSFTSVGAFTREGSCNCISVSTHWTLPEGWAGLKPQHSHPVHPLWLFPGQKVIVTQRDAAPGDLQDELTTVPGGVAAPWGHHCSVLGRPQLQQCDRTARFDLGASFRWGW